MRGGIYPSLVSEGIRTAEDLPPDAWLSRAAAHEARVRAWTDPHQRRASRGERHPVYDFLFDYYPFRPAQLRQWHPGPDLILAGHEAHAFLRWPQYAETDRGVALDVRAFPPKRLPFLRWLRGLLDATLDRPPFFGCFGLHEWAMVYRLEPARVRHAGWPLRLGPEEIATFVESQAIRCSHFDAFRFFAPEARPLNRLGPTRETTAENEQCGCLHANMDLYKWAFKLHPFAPSELIADCFALAVEIREADMRASPYDLGAIGFAPIPIETAHGRAEYERLQRNFSDRSRPLRERLLALCARLAPRH